MENLLGRKIEIEIKDFLDMSIKISEHLIGKDHEPFIMAEAGLNHNGDLERAFEMIKVAKNSGATAIKFQTFSANEIVLDKNLVYTYQNQGNDVTESLYDILHRCEFSKNEWLNIKNKCEEQNILFLSTVQNSSDLELLLDIGISAIKVGSDDFTTLPLLEEFTKTNLPIILSCGMADLEEISTTLETIGALDDYPTVLMLTTSQYPTPDEDANIKKLQSLSNTFPKIELGFSDHTIGTTAATLASALGACVFEKHFTLDHNLPGPDHWFAANPKQLHEWVDAISKSHLMLGNSEIKPTENEEKMKKLCRRSIVALKDISKGEILNKQNIGLRRPGNGISPRFFNDILSKQASKNIPRGTLLSTDDF